jgi:hypothetical protein
MHVTYSYPFPANTEEITKIDASFKRNQVIKYDLW